MPEEGPPTEPALPPAVAETPIAPTRFDKQLELVLGGKAKADDARAYVEQIAPHVGFSKALLLRAVFFLGRAGFRDQRLYRALAASLDVAALAIDGDKGFAASLDAMAGVIENDRVTDRTLSALGLARSAFNQQSASRGSSRTKAAESLETLYSMISKKTGKDLGGAAIEVSGTLPPAP